MILRDKFFYQTFSPMTDSFACIFSFLKVDFNNAVTSIADIRHIVLTLQDFLIWFSGHLGTLNPFRILKTYLTNSRLNKTPLHYILEESDFNFKYVRLCDLDIPRGKWRNFLQTFWVCIVCQLPFGVLQTNRLRVTEA